MSCKDTGGKPSRLGSKETNDKDEKASGRGVTDQPKRNIGEPNEQGESSAKEHQGLNMHTSVENHRSGSSHTLKQDVHSRSFTEARVKPSDQGNSLGSCEVQPSHAGSFQCGTHSAGRGHEATLPLQQGRVFDRVEGPRGLYSQGSHGPGTSCTTSRSSQGSRLDRGQQGSHNHGRNQEGQQGRVALDVLKSRSRDQHQDHHRRDEAGTSSVRLGQWQWGDGVQDWQAQRGHLLGTPPQPSQLSGVGTGGGPTLQRPRLAAGAAGSLGTQDGSQQEPLGGTQGLCKSKDGYRHPGEHDQEEPREVLPEHTQAGGGHRGEEGDRTRNDGDDEDYDGADPYPQRGAEGGEGQPEHQSIQQESEDNNHLDGVRGSGSAEGGSAEGGSGSLSMNEIFYHEPRCTTALLSETEVARIQDSLETIVSTQWAEVANCERLFLMEVACAPDSALTSEALAQGLSAERVSLFNGHDLTTPEGLRKTLQRVSEHRPQNVWISTECGAFSPMQNLNQRNEQQKQDLRDKQRAARKQHIGGLVVAYHARSLGSEVHWEWSRRCRAWKWKLMDNMRQHMGTSTAVIGGCRVGLRDPKTQKFLGKEWRVETTSEVFAQKIHCPCLRDACQGDHALCEGKLTRMSAFYTSTMVKKLVFHMKRHHTTETVQATLSCQSNNRFGSHYDPDRCNCRLFRDGGLVQVCARCQLQLGKHPKPQRAFVGDEELGDEEGPVGAPEAPEEEFNPEERKEWEKKIRLLHSATGHGSLEDLRRTLREKGVPRKVLRLASQFKCDVCEERKRPQPRRVATLECIPKRWKILLADCAVWRHPKTGKRLVVALGMDQGSRFLVGKVMVEGSAHNASAEQYRRFFEEHWQPYFGCPEVLRYDAEGAWRSRQLDRAFAGKNIFTEPIPGDAHWHISPLERSIKWLKEFLSKASREFVDSEPISIVSAAVATWNQREVVRGFSPHQHALGQAPDIDGRFFETQNQGIPVELMEDPEGAHRHQHELRLSAEETFVRWQAKSRVDRALQSKGRPFPEYTPGDVVFYWRGHLRSGENGERFQTGTYGGYAGPARVLALETRRDTDGNLRPSSVVWLVRNNRLLKASVEQLRLSSDRERVMYELDRPPQLPWTISELAKPLSRQEFDDITGEGPPPGNQSPHFDPTARFWTIPPAKRARVKQPDPNYRKREHLEMEQDEDVEVFPPEELVAPRLDAPSSSSTGAVRRPTTRTRTAPYENPEDPQLLAEGEQEVETAFWQEESAAVSLEFELPTSRHGWMRMAKDPFNFLVTAMKKKAVEVREKSLDEPTRARFREAKMVEMNKFLKSEALESLPAHLQPSKSQAMQMRWLLTWKVDGNGETVPKARIVILGYQDPQYEHRVTYAPTTTRHTRQLMLQAAASKKWEAWKGDVAAAFLQGRECQEDLFCIPTPELCDLMQIPKDSVARLRKTCYGLVQAPYEWYETVRTYLISLGFRQCDTDPCCWVYIHEGQVRIIISGHVDDFMFVADPSDPIWIEKKSDIQEHFRWGEFEHNDFTQCGVQISRKPTGEFHLSQERYMSHVKEIPISQERRKQRKEEVTEWERTSLRGLLGALSWHCSQVGFRFSAYVSLSLSEVPTATVEQLVQANALLHRIKDASREPLRIFPVELTKVGMYAWCDASSQNRQGGYSTKGIFIGAASTDLSKGAVAQISPMFWQSAKITRVCRAPGAAEAHAAVDAEDVLFLIRYQWQELSGKIPEPRRSHDFVRNARGTLVTDSRSVYDKLQRPYISPTGESKKIDIELTALKQSQNETDLEVRWVNSEAMLANTLTKRGEDQQMNRFIACQQVWRIVDDPERFSGKRLKQQGRDLLDLKQTGEGTTDHGKESAQATFVPYPKEERYRSTT